MNYSKIIRQSWKIVKENKALWIFGIIVAAFTGNSFSLGGNFSSFRYLGNFQKFFGIKDKLPIPAGSSGSFSPVFGNTNNPWRLLTDLFYSIPLSFWAALIFGFLLLLLFGIILRIFITNWSKGALLGLANEADKNSELTLHKGSLLGKKVWLRLFLSSLILRGGYLAIIILTFSAIFLIFLVPIVGQIILLVVSVPLILICFISLVFLTSWLIFCQLAIIIDDYPLKKALTNSFSLTKKFFWSGLLMQIINGGIGCLASLIAFGVTIQLLIIVGVTVLGFSLNKLIGVFFLVIAGGVFFIFIILGLIINGIVKALTETNWVIFYNELKKK